MTDKSSFPDFWGYLQQFEARLSEEASKVTSDSELAGLIAKWTDPQVGVLRRMQDDPIFAMAKPSARQIFLDQITNRIRGIEREWRDIWRSLYES